MGRVRVPTRDYLTSNKEKVSKTKPLKRSPLYKVTVARIHTRLSVFSSMTETETETKQIQKLNIDSLMPRKQTRASKIVKAETSSSWMGSFLLMLVSMLGFK
jgi:hypothetical protein